MQVMSENEILKKIDLLLDITEQDLLISTNTELDFRFFFEEVKSLMKNYEQVLEVNHFKQTEI